MENLFLIFGLAFIIAGVSLYIIYVVETKKLDRRERELDKSFRQNSLKGWKEYE
jgi:hypothetical protein